MDVTLQNVPKFQYWPVIPFDPGLSPTNKKTQKNAQNSGKIFRLLKIPQIFQIVFLSKILRKNLQKSCQLAAPKNLPGKFSDLQEKFVDIKFSEFVRKFFRTQIFSW
jgi:hypothetical protein